MFITPVDIIVSLITLTSAFLAMVRGLSREALSLLSWILAAIVTYFLFSYVSRILEKYLSNSTTAMLVAIIFVFVVSLIIISVITMKIADLVIDSRIGLLDCTLGFIFGVVRGVVIMALATLLINNMVKPENQSSWITQAKTKPMLEAIGNKIWNTLPQKTFYLIDKSQHNQTIK